MILTRCVSCSMMKTGYPLVLKYSVGSLGDLRFCLAAKHNDDDDSDMDD